MFGVQSVGLDDGVERDHDVERKAPIAGKNGGDKLANPGDVNDILEVLHDTGLSEILSRSNESSSSIKLGSTSFLKVDHHHGSRDAEDDPGNDGGGGAQKEVGGEKEDIDRDSAGPESDESLLVVGGLLFERVSSHCELVCCVRVGCVCRWRRFPEVS